MWQIHCAHHAKHTNSKTPNSEHARMMRDFLKKCKFKIWTKNLWNAGSDHENDKPQPACWRRLQISLLRRNLHRKNTAFRAPAISQNFTTCCARHEQWHSNITKYCARHGKPPSKISKDFKRHKFCETSSKLTIPDFSYSQLPLSFCTVSCSTLSFCTLRYSHSQLVYCLVSKKFVCRKFSN